MATGDFSFRQLAANLGFAPNPVDIERQAAAKREQEEFEASPEGQAQRAYNEALAYEGAPEYQQFVDLPGGVVAPAPSTTPEARQALVEANKQALKDAASSSAAKVRDLAKGLILRYGGSPLGPLPAAGIDVGGRMVKDRPTLPAEVLSYPIGAAGAAYDLVQQAIDSNPNLSQAERLAATTMAAAGFVPGGTGAKAGGKVAKQVAKEALEQGAKGYKKLSGITESQAEVLRSGSLEDVQKTLTDLGLTAEESSDLILASERGTSKTRAEQLTRERFMQERLDEIQANRAAESDVKGLSTMDETAPQTKADELPEESADETALAKGADDGADQKATDGLGSFDVGDDAAARSRFLEGNKFTRENHKYGDSVSEVSEEFVQDPNNKIFMTPDGGAGVAVTPEGDIVSGWSRPDSPTKATAGLFGQAMRFARYADAYDINGVLPNTYRRYGMVPVGRVAFDPDYVKPDWDFDVYGEPDVVLLVRDPKNVLGVKSGEYVSEVKDTVPLFDTWEEAVEHQKKMSDKVARSQSVFETPPHTSTFDEYIAQFIPEDGSLTESALQRHREMHRNYVDRALALDLPVPPRVLDEYPGILAGRQPGNPELMASPKEDILQNAERAGLVAMGEGTTLPRPKVTDEQGEVVKYKTGKKAGQEKDRAVVISDIAEFLDADHKRRMELAGEGDRALDPSNPKDMGFMIKEGAREAAYQLKSAQKTGREWYDKVMARAFELSSIAFPELATMEEQRVILTALAAITSPQTKAAPNFKRALELYEQLFPRKPGTRKIDFDNLGRMHGYRPDVPLDPKTGKGKLYGLDTVRAQIVYLQSMIDDFGVEGTAQRLLTPESYRAMEVDLAQRNIKGKGKKVARPIGKKLDEYDLPAATFGPKVGPFFMNLNGLYEVTADLWLTRTYNRLRGDMFTVKKGQREVADSPRSAAERELMKEFVRGVAEEIGTTEQQAQAILWFYEQRLFSQLGVPSASTAFDEGAEMFLESRGFDF